MRLGSSAVPSRQRLLVIAAIVAGVAISILYSMRTAHYADAAIAFDYPGSLSCETSYPGSGTELINLQYETASNYRQILITVADFGDPDEVLIDAVDTLQTLASEEGDAAGAANVTTVTRTIAGETRVGQALSYMEPPEPGMPAVPGHHEAYAFSLGSRTLTVTLHWTDGNAGAAETAFEMVGRTLRLAGR